MNQYETDFKQGYDTANDEWLERIGRLRAEIKEHADRLKDSLYGDGMRHCIDIIDKYKAEIEQEEDKDL